MAVGRALGETHTGESTTRSRRTVLTAALGAAGGAVATQLARPLAVSATVAPLEMGTDNTSDASTRPALTGPAAPVLGVNTATMPAYETGAEVVAIGSDRPGDPALHVVTANTEMATGMLVEAAVSPDGPSYGIQVTAGTVGVKAEQQQESGAGLMGWANGTNASGVEGGGKGYSTAGVAGWSTGAAGTGVIGTAAGTGTGGWFKSEHGTALKVGGPAQFSRSGRALVARGHSCVDITVPGGLHSSAAVLATIQTYRSGVAVAGVRLNYPWTGKARIYLTKVASTTATTPVGWFVVG